MIKLFVLDIDGCISHPFRSPDWEAITQIRELNLQSREDDTIPSLTLCTGRPFPYAEAVAQWLDVRHPFVFESSLIYFPKDHRVQLPCTTEMAGTALNGSASQIPESLARFRTWLSEELLPSHPGAMMEFSKLMDAGVVSNDKELINRIYKRILQVTREHYPELEVHRTEASVNTVPAGNNKQAGFEQLCRELRVPLSQMAYIGDSEADIAPLQIVAMPFAPSNAIGRVQQTAEVIPLEATQAVLEAYRRIIQQNRNGS